MAAKKTGDGRSDPAWFANFFANVRVRDWWNPKCQKFQPPMQQANASYDDLICEYQQNVMSKSYMENTIPPPV